MSAIKAAMTEQDWFAHEINQAEQFIVHGLEKEIRKEIQAVKKLMEEAVDAKLADAAEFYSGQYVALGNVLTMLNNYGELKGE